MLLVTLQKLKVKLDLHSDAGTWVEGVWKQGPHENI
jgi:hypothetical protein